MAAVVVTGNPPFVTKTLALGGGDLIQHVQFPTWVRRVTLAPVTNDVRLTHEGADTAALGADFFPITAGVISEQEGTRGSKLTFGRGVTPVLRLAAVLATTVYIMFEQD